SVHVVSYGLPLRRKIRTLPIKATLTCLSRAVNEWLEEATLWLIMISLSCTWISITSHPLGLADAV
ncbi:hypothetical protein EMCG_05148, partial [[Emmonsia] crescens]